MSRRAFLLYSSAEAAFNNRITASKFLYAGSEEEAKDALKKKLESEGTLDRLVGEPEPSRMSKRGWRVEYELLKPMSEAEARRRHPSNGGGA